MAGRITSATQRVDRPPVVLTATSMSACATSSPDGTRRQGAAPDSSPQTLFMENVDCYASNACRELPRRGVAMKPVGKPNAGNRHVRFDERGEKTECCRMAQATAPLLDSTNPLNVVAFRPITLWHFDAAEWAPSTASFSTGSADSSRQAMSALPQKQRMPAAGRRGHFRRHHSGRAGAPSRGAGVSGSLCGAVRSLASVPGLSCVPHAGNGVSGNSSCQICFTPALGLQGRPVMTRLWPQASRRARAARAGLICWTAQRGQTARSGRYGRSFARRDRI